MGANVIPTPLRQYRQELGLSQQTFAARLGVGAETHRTWDSGRRPVPADVLSRARALAGHPDDRKLLPLSLLASLIGVHVRTLRTAARDGRLPILFDTRTTFRSLRARATLAAAETFRRTYFNKPVRPADRRVPLRWADVPPDYDDRIRAVRQDLGLTQAQLAHHVGAACKAVVYQWEARKRCPSPVFWQRIRALERSPQLGNS
jgi:DNA-binding transcriptional regulator YiaG